MKCILCGSASSSNLQFTGNVWLCPEQAYRIERHANKEVIMSHLRIAVEYWKEKRELLLEVNDGWSLWTSENHAHSIEGAEGNMLNNLVLAETFLTQ